LSIYLQQDQDFERVSLGLSTRRADGLDVVRRWEKLWHLAEEAK